MVDSRAKDQQVLLLGVAGLCSCVPQSLGLSSLVLVCSVGVDGFGLAMFDCF